MRSSFAALFLMVSAPALCAEDSGGAKNPSGLVQVTGEDLQKEITGNTLTGRHATGMPYSEFHAPDGRIFGHNNHVPVRDGCWVVRNDEVCYTYEKGPSPGIFCWRFFRAPGGYTIYLPRSGTVGTAKLETGNPMKFDDGGQTWSCDALLSRSPERTRPDGIRNTARLD